MKKKPAWKKFRAHVPPPSRPHKDMKKEANRKACRGKQGIIF